jgi:inhibitor of cysteine peptidase
MKLILGAAVLALTSPYAWAQASPSTGEAATTVASPLATPSGGSPATAVSSPNPALAEPGTDATPTPEPPPVDNSKIKEEVNLAETPTAESFEIAPPTDEADADTAAEVTGKLEGDEETTPRPEVTGTVEVTAKNQGQTVRAEVGNLIRITLEANPSTGYNWELRDFDYGVAEFHSSDLVARDNAGNVLFGAPGDTVITLQAVQPGTQNITLVYRRQWEPPDQVAETFTFTLEVAGEAAAPAASPEASPAP